VTRNRDGLPSFYGSPVFNVIDQGAVDRRLIEQIADEQINARFGLPKKQTGVMVLDWKTGQPVWREVGHTWTSLSKSSTTATDERLDDAGTWNNTDWTDVTVETGTTGIVTWGARISAATAGSAVILGFSISGASTRANSSNEAYFMDSDVADQRLQADKSWLVDDLTAGENVFTLEARVSGGGTGSVDNPYLFWMPLN